MKKNKTSFSVKRRAKGYELFLIVYIILIIVPSIILASGENAWINVILAVVLVALVLFYYFDNVYDASVSWGMRAVYESQDQERYFLDRHRMHFWKETDVALSYDIKLFLKNKIHELAVMAKLGSKMRILLLDPQSAYVPLLERACSMKKGEYAYYVLQIQSFALRAAQAVAEKTIVDIEIKYYDSLPLDNMLRAYDVLFIYDNKENSDGGAVSYAFEKDLNGYNFYKSMFEEKWNDPNFSYTKEITADMVPNMRYFSDNDSVRYTV